MSDNLSGLLFTLWRASWQGALVVLFIWLLSRVFARRLPADTHCRLWRLSYIKLLVGLIWGGAILLPWLSPLPPSLPTVQTPTMAPSNPDVSAMPPVPQMNAPAPVAQGANSQPRWDWRMALAAAYGLGVAVCLGRLLLAAGKTRRVLQTSIPNAVEAETACAAELAQRIGLRRVPSVARSASVASPVYIAGRILLPAEAHYTESNLRLILAHELAHARRRDLGWEWLGTLVQVAFFFHPLVVLARREERLAREAAADALALRVTDTSAADYGKLLLSLALAQTHPRPALIGAVGVIEGGTPLRRRLLALRDGGASRRNPRRLAVALVPLMLLILTPWQMTHGQGQPPTVPSASRSLDFPTLPVGDKRITGVVRDERGKPVAGLGVSLGWSWSQLQKNGSTLTGSAQVGLVWTDAQGRFTFSHLPAGKFQYGVGSLHHQYVDMNAPLLIRQSDTVKTLRIVVSQGSLITGRVVDGQTGKPLAGVMVGAGPIPPRGQLAKWEGWDMPSDAGPTDAQGRYQVRVTPGNVFVGVGRIVSNALFSRRVRAAVTKVSVRPGQTASAADIPVFLHPVIVCEGPDGQPAANAKYSYVSQDMAKDGYSMGGDTDNTGTIVLDRCDNGSFSIRQDTRTASGTFRWSPGSPLVLKIDGGQTSTYPSGIGIVSLTEGASITGNVVSEDGRPIPKAVIRVLETNPKNHYVVESNFFTTDAAGGFHLPLNPKGEYHVYIRADGFNQVAVSNKPLILTKGATTNLGTVRLLRAAGTVSGWVVDSSGKPMSGVVASVQGGKTLLSAAVTDDQGRFRIPNVVSGETLSLELCLTGEVSDSGTALLTSNEQMEFSGVKASPTERKIIWRPHS